MPTAVICPENHVDFLLKETGMNTTESGSLDSSEPTPIAREECEVCKGGALLASYIARFGIGF